MPDLERALTQLDPEWPATPAFDLRPQRARRRRRLVAAALAALLAVGIAFAVPPARSAILRFFHLGGVSIERVDTLPPAQHRSLRASLGVPITRADAERLLVRPFAVAGVRLYRQGTVVSALIEDDPPLLLSELSTGHNPYVLKKFAAGQTRLEYVAVRAGIPAIWVSGGRHVSVGPALPPRYAGNTLLWQSRGITYRLEGASLTLAHALGLARSLH